MKLNIMFSLKISFSELITGVIYTYMWMICSQAKLWSFLFWIYHFTAMKMKKRTFYSFRFEKN